MVVIGGSNGSVCRVPKEVIDSEALFAQGFERSPIGLALTNVDGTFHWVNRALAGMLGYASPQELVGVSFASVTHPDDAAENLAAIGMLLERDVPYQTEKRYVRRDGGVVDVLLAVTAVRDPRGSPIMFFTQVEDITDRKAAELDRARLAAIVEYSQDAIVGKDRAGVITVWNRGAEQLYGYTASEAVGRHVSMLVPETRRGEDRSILERVMAGERIEHYQTERVCKNGAVVDVSLSASPILDQANRVSGASSIARDMRAAIRAQEQITLQTELLDEVDAAVVLSDAEGVVRYWSRGAQHLYGYLAAEAIGRRIIDLVIPEHGRAELLSLRARALAGRSVSSELDVHDKQGRAFPIDVRYRRVALGTGHGLISVSVDITERRNAEQAIRRHAQGQAEIADLGRLALRGAPLEELFDAAVGAAWRVLGSDYAWLLEQRTDDRGPLVRAEVGWPNERIGEPIDGEEDSLAGHVVRTRELVAVEDWRKERRFPCSDKRLERGVGSSVGVLVGSPDSPFGVLEVQYIGAGMVPSDCRAFLEGLANVLGEAIQSHRAQELIARQRESLAAMTESLRGLVGEKERLVEQIPGVVIVVDLYDDGSGELVFVSRHCETIFGVAASDLLGDAKRFLRHVHADDRRRVSESVRRQSAAGTDPLPGDYRFVRPDGVEVWLRGVSALVHAGHGVQRVQSVLFDITAEKQAELDRDRLEVDLRLAQKLEGIGQLAAGVAHEINTPVQFVGNSVTFLKRAADKLLALTEVYQELLITKEPINQEERRRRALIAEQDANLEYLVERIPPAFERAQDGIERVSSIVRAMRDFAHPSTERAPIDINQGIRTTLIVAKNEYKYVADLDPDLGQLPLVMANAGDLNQVFLNLIVNASHAIEARVGDSGERGTITVQTRADGADVVITISDTGCGIPPDIAGRVFDPFFTTKPVGRGTGQGLAIAHTIIVERHHGSINFEPNPAGGTTFRIVLPVDDTAATGHNLETVV